MSTATSKYPNPVYAVAGAGDIAYRQLLKFPRVAELRTEIPARVEALRVELPARVEALRTEIPARVEALRTDLPGAVNTFVAEAVQVYAGLVARGEKVVDGTNGASAPKKTGAKKAGPKNVAATKPAPKKVAAKKTAPAKKTTPAKKTVKTAVVKKAARKAVRKA